MWDYVDPSEVVEVDLVGGEGSSTCGMSEMDDIGASSIELEVGVSSIILAREKVHVARELKRYRNQQKRRQHPKRISEMNGELQVKEVGIDTPTIEESSEKFSG